MPRELTDIEVHNIKAAVDFIKRLIDCCPELRANDDFMSAFEELEETTTNDETIKEWWKAGDEDASEEAVTERRLWVLWVKYIWIRPGILSGNRKLSLDNCDGKEIAKLAFILMHEAYHLDGWSDGASLYGQDLFNLATWEINLLFHCPNFPCKDNVLEFIKGRLQETIGTINGLPWYKSSWFNINCLLKWLLRFAYCIILVLIGWPLLAIILVLLGEFGFLAGFGLVPILIIALIITIIWMILDAIFG